MTPRKAAPRTGEPALSPASFPQLESFFSGYLHEDFVAEYGSPEGALRAWRMDASAKENQQLDGEAARLIAAAGRLPFDTIADFVRGSLGSAWRPPDARRLERLLVTEPKRTRR